MSTYPIEGGAHTAEQQWKLTTDDDDDNHRPEESSMTSELQARLTRNRDRLRAVEAAARSAATVLGDLQAAKDAIENGRSPAEDGTVDDLASLARETFASLEADLFAWYLDELAVAFDAYEPEAVENKIDTLRVPFADLDAETVEATLDAVVDAFWRSRYVDASRGDDEFETVRAAFDADDRQAFEDALDNLVSSYHEAHREGIEQYTATFRNFFHTTYATHAEQHVDDLKSAFAVADEEAFEAAVEALEVAFDAHHATAIDDRIATLESGLENGDAQQIREQLLRFSGDIAAARAFADDVTYRLNADLESLVDEYPKATDASLSTLADPLQPVVMLPVHLETRFTEPNAQGECDLQIRVYPDDVHVDTHERGLTRAERDAGQAFWERLWWAVHDVPTSALEATLENRGESDVLADVDLASLPEAAPDRHDAVRTRAWRRLVERFDERRAGWVKRATKPPQGDDLLVGPIPAADIDAVDFGTLGDDQPTFPGSWTRPPRARLLPDRWVAIVDLGSERRTISGDAIREPLAVGPSPDPEAQSDSRPNVRSAPDWLSDFQAAKDVGMGLETTLSHTDATDGVESILVVGVKSSMTADESASALADLFDAHHYADGLEFLEPGTPTNNLDNASAGDSQYDSLDVECGSSLARAGTDGAKAARLLGVDPDQLGDGSSEHVFGHVPGAGNTSQTDARQFNQALWSATWGYYAPHMLAPNAAVDTDENLDYATFTSWVDSYRDHFADYVRAQGPLPTLRVGDQPYGVLPATTVDATHWSSLPLDGTAIGLGPDAGSNSGSGGGGAGGGSSSGSFQPASFGRHDVLDALVTAVRALRPIWDGSVDDVTVLQNVGEAPSGADAIEALLDVVSQDASSIGYRTRAQYGEEILDAATTDGSTLAQNVELALDAVEYAGGLDHLEDAFGTTGQPPEPRAAQTLLWGEESAPIEPLVADDLDAFLDALLDSPIGSLLVTEPGPANVEPSGDLLQEATSRFELAAHDPGSLLQALLYYATLQEVAMARARLGHLYDTSTFDLNYVRSGDVWSLIPEPEQYFWEQRGIVRRLDDEITGPLAAHPALESGERYATALDTARDRVGQTPSIAPHLERHTESLAYLADRSLDVDTAERLLTETLDLASHRLDAWATSIATRRLDDIRAHQAAAVDGTGSTAATYVGGWGYVEDIAKTDDPASDGYLQAPSIGHTTTGAVLRNGSLAFEDDRADLLDLDLSPERVGRAMEVIETVRDGQNLGTILGYRFERRLRESELARDVERYIPDFRALCPPVAGKQARQQDNETATEAAERDLVDGLALYRMWRDNDVPWGQRVDGSSTGQFLPSDDSEEHAAISLVLRDFKRTIDAVKDLLLAESVHRLLQGQAMGAGATVDALARGEAPPEIDVVDIPRTGTGVTHRILVLFGDADPAPPAAWPSTDRQVRASAEPALDAWIADILPDPTTAACVCAYEVTDDDGTITEEMAYAVRLDDLELSPLDLLSIAEGGTDAQRSELEQRVLYHVDRMYGVPAGAEIELVFKPVDEWLWSAGDLQGVSSLDGLTSFGEVLAAIEPLSELIAEGRAVDARDLRRPANAGSDGNVDALALRMRANEAVDDLSLLHDEFRTLLPAVERDDSGYDALRGLTAMATGVDDLSSAGVSPATAANDLDALDAQSVRRAAQSLADALDAGLLSFATIDGDVTLPVSSSATVSGVVAAAQGVSLDVTVTESGANPSTWTKTVTVGANGAFDATFDLSSLTAGDDVVVTAAGPNGDIASTSGTVVQSVDESPSTDSNVGPAADDELEAAASVLDDLATLGSAAAGLADAIPKTDRDALQAASTDAYWTAARSAPDWNPNWSSDVRTVVSDLLELPPVALPGFDHEKLTAPTWQNLRTVADAVRSGKSLIEYTSDERATLSDALKTLLTADDATLDAAIGDGLSSAAASLRDLASLTGSASDAVDAFRLAVLEGLRSNLFEASYFGVGAAVPQAATGYGDDAQTTLSRQAIAVHTEIAERLANAPTASDENDPNPDIEMDRLEAVFGESFTVLPPFAPSNDTELSNALTSTHSSTLQNGDPMASETWFQRSATVRDAPETLARAFLNVASLTDLSTTFDAGQTGPRFRVSQLPYAADDDWVGLPDAWNDDNPSGRLSLVTHTASAHGGTPEAGLFVDEWVETVPSDTETTGVAFQHDRPTNEPPQSLLVAVPPNDGGWSLDTLTAVVDDTVDLAKARTVDLSTLDDLGHFLPALTYATNSYDGPKDPPTMTLDLTDLLGGN